TNICNLECPACFTGAGDLGRPRSHLSLDLYRPVLAELAPYLLEVEFYNWGEPLLAKHIFPMIEEASAAGAHTTVSTNFSFPFDAARAERLVSSGLSVLGVSIDGARQESYEQYRRRGKLATVLENCRAVRDAKRRVGSGTRRSRRAQFPRDLEQPQVPRVASPLPLAHRLAGRAAARLLRVPDHEDLGELRAARRRRRHARDVPGRVLDERLLQLLLEPPA